MLLADGLLTLLGAPNNGAHEWASWNIAHAPRDIQRTKKGIVSWLQQHEKLLGLTDVKVKWPYSYHQLHDALKCGVPGIVRGEPVLQRWAPPGSPARPSVATAAPMAPAPAAPAAHTPLAAAVATGALLAVATHLSSPRTQGDRPWSAGERVGHVSPMSLPQLPMSGGRLGHTSPHSAMDVEHPPAVAAGLRQALAGHGHGLRSAVRLQTALSQQLQSAADLRAPSSPALARTEQCLACKCAVPADEWDEHIVRCQVCDWG